MIRTSVIGIFILISAGCGYFDRPPLDEETYMQIRSELEIIYMIHSYTGDTETTAEMLADLKAHYGFSIDDFMESYRFYQPQLGEEIARQERMIMAYNEERKRIDEVIKGIVTDVELSRPVDTESLRNQRAIGEQEDLP